MNRAKVFTITITNAATKQNFINSLNAMSEVLYAETNGQVSNNIIPVDGRFNQQWGMRNLTVPGADIHLDGATNIFTGNPNSIIAIIDNGVDRLHNDLAVKILGGDNGFQILVDGLGRQSSHGSHVAGIAAAISNNAGNNGVAGVDWQAMIHPKNIFDGNGDPDITQSIIDAVNFAADVWTFNNSWGTRNQDGTQGRYSVTIRSAFAQAYRNNRVSCIAMGNHHTGADDANDVASFPASINSGVIAVGATNMNDGVTGFSARGLHIDVSAPGNLIWSTNFNNGYIDLSGTSMATPHVSGLASLLKGFNPNIANDDIEQIIRLTADDRGAVVGFDNQFGTGRINAQRALQTLQAPNTLQQLSTTSGTIFSTSASMTRVFLGVPGFPDAAYIVKRSEVRKAITLPAMCNTIGVWGRGVGTTGYREEQNRSFGEGICEVVPGTLTAAGCTLRTWIYEVWSVNGQYLGFYPRPANNVVFQYTILGVPAPSQIVGPNYICSTSGTYTIANGVPVTWSISPVTGIANRVSTPTSCTLTKTGNGVVTLTAVSNNACPTNLGTITKLINVGLPQTNYKLSTIQTLTTLCGWDVVLSNFCNATGFVIDDYPLPYTQELGQTLPYRHLVQENVDNGPVTRSYTIAAVNQCGTGNYVTKSVNVPAPWRTGDCDIPAIVTPPPTNDSKVSIQVSPNPTTNTITATKNDNVGFTEIRIFDKLGTLRKQIKYQKNTKSATINVSNLSTDIYQLQVFDGVNWKTISFSKL